MRILLVILSLSFSYIINLGAFQNNIVNTKNKYFCFDKEFAELMSHPLHDYCKIDNSTKILNKINIEMATKSFNKKCSKNKDIVLPGFFEVFPMLEWKWPIWTMKNGKRIECKKNDDCKFPQSCCNHPIIPGNKFCCSGGYKERVIKHSYIPQEIIIN